MKRKKKQFKPIQLIRPMTATDESFGNLVDKFDLDTEEFTQMVKEFDLSESVLGELEKIISGSKAKISNQDLDLDTFMQENILEHYFELIIFLVIEQFVPQIKEKYDEALDKFSQPMPQLSHSEFIEFINIADTDADAYISSQQLTRFISQMQLQTLITLSKKDITDIVQVADAYVNNNNKITYHAFTSAYYEKIMAKRFHMILSDHDNYNLHPNDPIDNNNNNNINNTYNDDNHMIMIEFAAFTIVLILIIALITTILNKTCKILYNTTSVNKISASEVCEDELVELNL